MVAGKTSFNNYIISFLGPPGAGKGTVARRACHELGFFMLSTGDLCRKHRQEGTVLGKKIDEYISVGHFVPDEIICQMVWEWLNEHAKGEPIILDGYPRTIGQAECFLSDLSKNIPNYNFKLLVFEISNEEVIDRLSNRLVCTNKSCQAIYSRMTLKPRQEGICDACGGKLSQRVDDNPAVITERLDVYKKHLNGLLCFYKEAGTAIYSLNVSDKSEDQVFSSFIATVS